MPRTMDPISGMVRVAPATYLYVVDRKWDKEPGPRTVVYSAPYVEPQSQKLQPPTVTPIEIEKWPGDLDPPSDLEAVTAIAGRDGHFLLVESSYYCKKFGRAIHVRLEHRGRWRLFYVGSFEPRLKPESGNTKKWDEIEGAATIEVNGSLIMVYATRGDKDNPSMLGWVPLTECGQSYTPLLDQGGSAKLADLGECLGNRGAATLQLNHESKGWRVRTVATFDPGRDFGPFRSAIYDADVLVWDGVSSPYYASPSQIHILWTLEGLKVEALAESPDIPSAAIAIATDDEVFGGIWRVLPSARPKCITASMISEGDFQATELIERSAR